jgi:hypothetical protein
MPLKNVTELILEIATDNEVSDYLVYSLWNAKSVAESNTVQTEFKKQWTDADTQAVMEMMQAHIDAAKSLSGFEIRHFVRTRAAAMNYTSTKETHA